MKRSVKQRQQLKPRISLNNFSTADAIDRKRDKFVCRDEFFAPTMPSRWD